MLLDNVCHVRCAAVAEFEGVFIEDFVELVVPGEVGLNKL